MSRPSRKNLTKEIAQEIDVLDDMLSSLVELLEERGILTQEEWEARIKQKYVKSGKFLNFRELQEEGFKKKEKK